MKLSASLLRTMTLMLAAVLPLCAATPPGPANARALTPDQLADIGRFAVQLEQSGVTGTALATQIEAKVAAERSGAASAPVPAAVSAPASGPRGTPQDMHGLGAFVVGRLDAGLRGEALADAIHAEMIRRGVGVGHKPSMASGPRPPSHPMTPMRGAAPHPHAR